MTSLQHTHQLPSRAGPAAQSLQHRACCCAEQRRHVPVWDAAASLQVDQHVLLFVFASSRITRYRKTRAVTVTTVYHALCSIHVFLLYVTVLHYLQSTAPNNSLNKCCQNNDDSLVLKIQHLLSSLVTYTGCNRKELRAGFSPTCLPSCLQQWLVPGCPREKTKIYVPICWLLP